MHEVQRYNILIVEDNPGDYILVEEYLEEGNNIEAIHWAQDFSEAETFLEENKAPIDVVLLDLTLPDKQGESLINGLIQIAPLTPIIILTGYADSNFAIKALSLGVSDYLLKDDLNNVILVKSIAYNIERNKNFLLIKESEKRYSELFHLSPLPMWVFDTEAIQVLDVNDAAISHYGFTYEEFLKLSPQEINKSIPNKNSLINVGIELQDDEELSEKEFIHSKKCGQKIIVEITSNTYDYKGREAMIILVNDITVAKQQFKAIEKQNENLREIAWTQSHVVRAPLARLIGLVNIMTDKRVSIEERDTYCELVQKSADELDEIIKDVVKTAQHIEIDSP